MCFAVGNAVTGTGEITATTNGGTTWSYQSDGSQLSLYGVSCWDATDCVAVGASGRIALTSNGTGWSWLNSPTSNTLYSVDVSNQSAGTAVGASGTILGYSLGCNSSGGLNFTPPTSFAWPSTALTGKDQSITTQLNVSPDDESGSGAGWNLTATSTPFISGTHTLPATAAQITGATETAGTGQCSAPSNQISYPVTVPAATTPPSAVKIYDAAAGSGAGPADVGLTASSERARQCPERGIHLHLDADALERAVGRRWFQAASPGKRNGRGLLGGRACIGTPRFWRSPERFCSCPRRRRRQRRGRARSC